ncbi:hypothetical protein [Paracoccus salsus]|uniref:hypothetical protein n=1 Tax=Paracoccus salsus TaxID=2911061 RepID=UPI001F15C490|nr:hypothetical protein [Paracoccus salsus]MCF3972591.1 hypothetical protein [Paracoccus salsus]
MDFRGPEMKKVIFATAVALFAGPSLAQEPLSPNIPFDEQRHERAKVSGGLVVGAMFTADDVPRASPLLTATLPAGDDAVDTVCVRVTSRDGTYESVNTYSIGDAARRETLTFDYPTRYPDVLGSAPTVARMNLGGCDREGPVIPVVWSDAGQPGQPGLVIYVNTAGADTIVAYDTADGEVVARCAQVEETGGIKYSAACPVDPAGLPREQPVTIHLDVTRNRVVETYEVEVVLAGD